MITIIDYGAGNIGSVLNMIRHVGGKAEVASEASAVLAAEKILLPGVGSFDHAVNRLTALGLVDPLKRAAQSGIPCWGSVWACSSWLMTAKKGPFRVWA